MYIFISHGRQQGFTILRLHFCVAQFYNHFIHRPTFCLIDQCFLVSGTFRVHVGQHFHKIHQHQKQRPDKYQRRPFTNIGVQFRHCTIISDFNNKKKNKHSVDEQAQTSSTQHPHRQGTTRTYPACFYRRPNFSKTKSQRYQTTRYHH